MCQGTKNTKKKKRVLHIIKELHKREVCRPIFKELKVLTVTALHILEIMIYIKKKITKEFRHICVQHKTKMQWEFDCTTNCQLE